MTIRVERLSVAVVAFMAVLWACASPATLTPTRPGVPPTAATGQSNATRSVGRFATPTVQLSGTPADSTSEVPLSTTPATPTPPATPDPNATVIVLNPCSLITSGEAASALGAPVSRPIRAGGGCIYVDTASQRHVITVFAVTAASAADTVEGHLYLLGAFGVPFTSGDAARLEELRRSGDLHGVVEGLLAMPASGPGLQVEALQGLGDAAVWASKEQGIVRQGFALIARGQALLGIDLVATSARDNETMRDTARLVAERMLDRLPEQFTVTIARPTATPAIEITIVPATALTATAASSPVPATPQAPSRTPDVEPPAFSQPVLSGSQLVYGGSCGSTLLTMTVKIIDPSSVYGIQSAHVVLRLVESAAGGNATGWTRLPMHSEGNDTWSRTLFSETDLPGYDTFPSAVVEYYFVAANGLGLNGESPRRAFELMACPPGTP
jgi:hypothetical protein